MTLDDLFLKKYDINKYNCSHFVIDAFKIITGCDLSSVLNWQKIKAMPRKSFKLETEIKDKTLLCFMSNKHENHIGLLYKNKILHFRSGGAEYQPVNVATRYFKRIRFYSCSV